MMTPNEPRELMHDRCPHCGADFEASPREVKSWVMCPTCGTPLSAGANPDAAGHVAAAQRKEKPPEPDPM